jgi:outer membrane protein OmpA-like peptidoglycan-associated protein
MKASDKKFAKWLVAGLFLACEGCAAPDRVVLLPNADGSPSAVIVKTSNGERVIDQPYEAATVSRFGSISVHKENPEAVHARYAPALGAQPKRAASYIVYYLNDKVEISPESRAVVEELKADLKTRSAPEIVIIGHTDRVGTMEYNDKLSLDRAREMRGILVDTGIPSSLITVSGRGEREPMVDTADEVHEPKNRRVEISVR